MNLKQLVEELSTYRNADKKVLFANAIEDRLNKALVEYYKNLSKAYDKLHLYSDNYELKLINKLNKGMK